MVESPNAELQTRPVIKAATDTDFFGHPRGLFYLAFTEAWERFSFYGMTALVVLYMVDQLLLPGHIDNIIGLSSFRAGAESVFGPLTTQALASQLFGLYSGFVYFTPLLGGMIADRWIGQRNAVIIGAISMSAGHVAMIFDQSFLLALALLVIGSGFLKGNISAQVGALYPPEDDARRTRGFMIFSTGITIGAIFGPLLCGLLAQLYGWHYGFGAAAILMFVGLATYLRGYRYLPARVERRQRESGRLSAADWRIVGALIAVVIITIFQSTAYDQIYNVKPLWIQQYVAATMAGIRIPIPWYLAFDSLVCILWLPPVFWIWRRQASRGREPGELSKIGIGAWIAAGSNLILVGAIFISHGSPVPAIWPLLHSAGLGLGFLYYWPTLLALVSRAAPPRVNATMMGISFMSLFVANNLVGWIGGFYEKMQPIEFWALHAAIGAAGGILVAVFGRRLDRVLRSA
jgi:proton-dependent oligopeptide transporter, POT family